MGDIVPAGTRSPWSFAAPTPVTFMYPHARRLVSFPGPSNVTPAAPLIVQLPTRPYAFQVMPPGSKSYSTTSAGSPGVGGRGLNRSSTRPESYVASCVLSLTRRVACAQPLMNGHPTGSESNRGLRWPRGNAVSTLELLM